MRLKTRITALSATLLIFILAASCAGKKGPAGGGPEPTLTKKEMQAAAERLAAEASPGWQTISMPASVRVNNSSLPRVSGTLTMVRDRDIRLSIRFLGMEMGALAVTDDSIKGYIKLKRVYVCESIRDLLGGYPATVGNLQSLLLDRLFTIGDATPDLSGASLTATGDNSFSILPRVKAGEPTYSFGVEMPEGRISSLTMSHKGRKAGVAYSGSPSGDLTLEATASSGGKTAVSASIELQAGRARIDDQSVNSRPFAIPQGYSRLSAASLLNALGKL